MYGSPIAYLNSRSPAELTVRAQAVSPLDRPDINLFLRFFPYQDVDSTRLADITTLDFRPVADRREWNADGRKIPLKTPPFRQMEMNPIEAEFVYDERLMNRIAERAGDNEQLIRNTMQLEVPRRVDVLTDAVYRRNLVDAMNAWATATIGVHNPQDGTTVTAAYGVDATRYQIAQTAWSDPSVNAYQKFTAFLDDAVNRVGPIKGVVLRRATQNAILADAPTLANGVLMTRGMLADRISQEIGYAFEFAVLEQTVDVFNDGGASTTRTAIWPTQTVAVIPEGDIVGRTARAPVRRAGKLVPGLTPNEYDIRGVAIFPEARKNGKELAIQAQQNAMPIPDEQVLYVINCGV